MRLRLLLTMVNLAVFLVAIVFAVLDPSIGFYLEIVLIAWLGVSLGLFYSRWGRGDRPPAPPAPRPTTDGTPGPPASPPLRSSDFGFCIYCGTNLPAGAAVCPSCGRPVRGA